MHRDLRVSVTDRCNLRCTYCMPPDFSDWMPGDDLLSIDELMTVIYVAVDEGVTSIRLTGGEPLIRPDIVEIVARINALPTPAAHQPHDQRPQARPAGAAAARTPGSSG